VAYSITIGFSWQLLGNRNGSGPFFFFFFFFWFFFFFFFFFLLRDTSSPPRSAVAHQGQAGRWSEQGGHQIKAMASRLAWPLGDSIGSWPPAAAWPSLDGSTAGAVAGIAGTAMAFEIMDAGRRGFVVESLMAGALWVRRSDQPLLHGVHHALGRWRSASWCVASALADHPALFMQGDHSQLGQGPSCGVSGVNGQRHRLLPPADHR